MEKISSNEIVPHKGYGHFLFGTEYPKVVELLGDPDEVIQQDDFEDEIEEDFADSITAFFDEHGLAMFFEQLEKDGPMTLQSIEIDEPEASMFGKKIFTIDKKELVSLIEKNTGEKAVLDSDEEFAEFEVYDFDKNGISLQYDDEGLVSVTIYNMD
jgi:hypothetical protein